MKKHLIPIFIPMAILLQLAHSFNCADSKDCFCYNNSVEFEFQCPPDLERYSMFVKPGHVLKIECSSTVLEYSTDTLPDIHVGELEQFVLRFCPLPETHFKGTLEKFNITSIKEMLLLGDYDRKVVYNISRQLFHGLYMLEKLTVNLGQATFEENFLSKLPNLVKLNLASNRIETVNSNLLKYTPKLRFLDLSRNLITSIPNGVFENLPGLQTLHLWNNKLSTLDKNTFSGLSKLRSLELSRNKITHLDEDTFSGLVELSDVSLSSNNLSYITSGAFRNNTALYSVRLGRNFNINLSDYIFSDLPNLADVNIDNSKLETIPENSFKGSTNLAIISLSNNGIKVLPAHVFKNLTSLKILNLSRNKIMNLPTGIFDSLTQLEQLKLDHNLITKVSDIEFRSTRNLKVLSLRNNGMQIIDVHAFFNLSKLIELDVSHNQYNLSYGDGVDISPFGTCSNLEKLKLSHNFIEQFPAGILDTGVNLKELHLDHNNIGYLNVMSLVSTSRNQLIVGLEHNNISIVDFLGMENTVRANMELRGSIHNVSNTVVHISHNPIRCDCANFHFIQYNQDKLNPMITTMVDINIDELFCTTPSTFNHTLVSTLTPQEIMCPLDDQGCPTGCSCELRPADKCAIVNCAGLNLTEPPTMYLTIKKLSPVTSDLDQPLMTLENIEVHLEDNLLETSPYDGLGYDNVTKLFLSNNLLTSLSWIPSKVKVLALDGNKFHNINADVFNQSSTLENLTLSRNPWRCDCSLASLQTYLIEHYTKVHSYDVVCENNQTLIEKKELCETHTATTATTIVIPILLLICISALIFALYFYYQEEIKTWLYAKNLCLWFVTEEELDKHKTYDVFLSYSHKDEEFVEKQLLPALEAGPDPFKVCIHVRDWLPGEFIATQVVRSVLDSRRTLVVLSENFLESVWGKMEFRTAHTQAVDEGRARVVVIKYGELKDEEMDEELKAYLKTNTYLEWDDPWFWNKLRYALPHSRSGGGRKNHLKQRQTCGELAQV